MTTIYERARGTLLGLACGDALGRPVEFQSADEIREAHGEVREMLADGTHGQPAGTVSDDTDLALCLARSLVECGEFDGADVADRFVEWYESDPFDVGGMTRESILEYDGGISWRRAGRRVWERMPEWRNAGNGSLMRCAPLGVAFHGSDADRIVEISRQSSAITHADPRCTSACALLNLVVAGWMNDLAEPIERAIEHVAHEAPEELIEAVRADPGSPEEPDVIVSGYVVDTLQVALYEAQRAESAEEAIVRAVNRGGDTDTLGAVTGALVGARFGSEALPERWLAEIDVVDKLEELADELVELEP